MVMEQDFLTTLPCLNCLERLLLTEPRSLPSREGPAVLLATPTVGLQGGERHQVSIKYNLNQPFQTLVHIHVIQSRQIEKKPKTMMNVGKQPNPKRTLNTINICRLFLLFSFVSGA